MSAITQFAAETALTVAEQVELLEAGQWQPSAFKMIAAAKEYALC